MSRNMYDSDVTVWSPQGRLFQVEYAVEAIKLGSATVALKSRTHAVVAALKRSSELSYYQKKIIPIDKHIAVSISGFTTDARILSKFLRSESLNYLYQFDEPIPLSRLMTSLEKNIHKSTQRYDKRPYGVGLLVIGYDIEGSHIYEVKPNNVSCCKAMAIGARSQSAKTYLEKNLDSYDALSADELIRAVLTALRETLPSEQDLTAKNASVAIVGKNIRLKEMTENELEMYLKVVLKEKRRSTDPTIEKKTSLNPQQTKKDSINSYTSKID